MTNIKFFTFLGFIAFCAYALGADSGGIAFQIRDKETGNPAVLKLHDNHDGTKSLVVYSISYPSPTNTPTPTPTATHTPTPTPTPTSP